MNKILLSLLFIFLLISSGVLIGQFFGIQYYRYVPYIIWGIALSLFYLFLETNHTNEFMKILNK